MYYADVTVRIDTLPVYGSLYAVCAGGLPRAHARSGTRARAHRALTRAAQWNMTTMLAAGSAVAYIADQRKYLSACYESCDGRFGVGIALDGGNPLGSIAVPTNRLTAAANGLAVMYVPAPRWTGVDLFTFSVLVGVDASPEPGEVRVHVRPCRAGSCANDITDFTALPA